MWPETDAPTGNENVCSLGYNGSRGQTVITTRLTLSGTERWGQVQFATGKPVLNEDDLASAARQAVLLQRLGDLGQIPAADDRKRNGFVADQVPQLRLHG